MHQILGSLVIGAVAAEGVRKVAWRPFVKGAIREGIRLSRSIQSATSNMRAEAERLVEEARVELDAAPTAESRQ